LWKEFVPKVKWEFGVSGAEAGDEVVFKGSDGAFGGVAAVDVGRCELEIDVFVGEVLLKEFGSFIVEFHEFGAEAAGDKESVGASESSEEFGAGVVFCWFSDDCVAVEVVEDEEAFVARAGGLKKTAGLVCIYLSGEWLVVGVDGVVSFSGRSCGRWRSFGVCFFFGDVSGFRKRFWFCGASVRALLIEVSLDHGRG